MQKLILLLLLSLGLIGNSYADIRHCSLEEAQSRGLERCYLTHEHDEYYVEWKCNEGYIKYENRCFKEGELPQEVIEKEIAEFEEELAHQLALDEELAYQLILDEASLKAELEDNTLIFWKTQQSLLRKISSKYMDDVRSEWIPYVVTQRVEQKPFEEAAINKIDKTLGSLNERCRNLVDLVNTSKLSGKQRAKLAKRKSEKEAAGRVALDNLGAKQKIHNKCARAFNCDGSELAELRLAEKEYLKYAPCNDCDGGGVPPISHFKRYCPKFLWDGEGYNRELLSYGNWKCKAGYKKSGNSCVKE